MPDFTNVYVIISIVLIIAIILYTLKNLNRKTPLLFGIAVFSIGIFPMINIIEPAAGIVAERFVFSPSVGFCIAFAAILLWIFKIEHLEKFTINNLPINLKWIMCIVLVFFSARTISRNGAWKDHLTLYTNDIEYIPESAKAHSLLAIELRKHAINDKQVSQQQKKAYIDGAIFHFKKALEVYPEYFTALNNLGAVYFSFYGNIAEAEPYFEKAIKVKPEYYEAYYNLARCYENTKKNERAIEMYKKCLSIEPKSYQAMNDLIKNYLIIGQPEKAIRFNEERLNKNYDDALLYQNMGNIYLTIKDTVSAIKNYEKSLAINPNNQETSFFVQSYKFSHKN